MTTKLFLGTQAITDAFEDKHAVRKAVSENVLVNDTYQPIIDFTGVKNIKSGVLAYAYANNMYLIDASSLKDLVSVNNYGGYYTFYGCQNLKNIDLRSLTTIGGLHCCDYMFYNCGITGELNLPSLTLISAGGNNNSVCQYMFANCTGITSISMPNLKEIRGDSAARFMFSGCTSLTSANLSKLVNVSAPGNSQAMNGFFYNCSSLSSIDISEFFSMSGSCFGYIFQGCTNLTTLYFTSFNDMTYSWGTSQYDSWFSKSSGIQDIYFPALDNNSFFNSYYHRVNQFQNLLYNTTGVKLHFPSNLDPQTGNITLSSLTNYPNFGGIDTVLLFDQLPTYRLICSDNNTYVRYPKYDTANSFAWRNTRYLDYKYYTDHLNNMQVGDIIYSDETCTTQLTTVTSVI